MKKIKPALIIIFSVLAISILIYFVPIDKIIGNLPFINRFYVNTILEVVSINGKANVVINGKEYGETPVTVYDLPEDQYTVEIERISDTADFYNSHTFTLPLTRNTTSRIEIEIGPGDILHGNILYYTSVNSKDLQGTITVLSEAPDSKVYLNDEYVKDVPLISHILNPGEYDLKIVAPNYEELSKPIIVREGYLLNVKAFLFPIPINFNVVESE
jgi:hypothetical protein